MKRRVWTIGVFVALLPLLLVGAYGLAGASAAEEGPPPPHAQWRAAVERDLSRYQPTPLELAPAAAGVEQRPAAPEAVSYLEQHERIVFQDARDFNWELYVADGGGAPVRVTSTGAKAELHPRLAPDGQRIVFSSNRDRAYYELYTMAFDGSDVRRLTDNGSDDVNPDWSPDGTRIVFESYRDGQPEIYVMNADGSWQTRLTVFDGYDGQPVWSPDGKWIAFVSTRGGAGAQLFRMDPGGGQVQLIPTPGQATYPVWSPDGQSLAFSGDSNGDSWLELWTVGVDGSSPVLRHYSGGERDHWPRSWTRRHTGSTVAFTDIGFIQYQGNWYWTDAYLSGFYIEEAFLLPPPGFYRLIESVDAGWHPDLVSTDMIAPDVRLGIPDALQYRLAQVPVLAMSESGGSGLYGYEYAWQLYPGGAWIENSFQTSAISTIDGWLPGGQPYRARVRVWDNAGNRSAWRYSQPVMIFQHELVSMVTDNMGLGIPDVAIALSPLSFWKVYDGDGVYRNYMAEEVAWSGPAALQMSWSHPGFGSEGPRGAGTFLDYGVSLYEVILPPADDVVTNGDFGTGDFSGWATEGGVFVGSAAAIFPGTWGWETESISQTITITPGMVNATLSFFYATYNSGPVAPLVVEIEDAAHVATPLASITQGNGEPQRVALDVSPWVGQTVTLRFWRATATLPPTLALGDISVGSAFPDVWVRAAEQPAAWRGQTATLRLDYGNRSSLDAPDAEVTWALPGKLTLVSATPAPSGTAPLRWELGTLAAGEEGSIELVVMVKPTVIGGLASAPATVSTPHEAITGNNSTPLGVWVGGKVYLPGVGRD